MTARIAVGSVSMLAMGAALLLGASFWLNRPGASAHGTPWGDLSTLSKAAASQPSDNAQLLKLAALKTEGNADAPAVAQAVPAPPSSPVPTAATPTVATPPDASAVSQAVAAEPSPTAETAQAVPAQAAAPVQLAAAEVPAAVAAPVDDAPPATTKASGVNLNTASADALDRIGAGRVGRTIVAHRPYRSVKDLVNKRVLRFSDYQKVESRVRAD